jgi:hypothetical protein
VDRYLPHETGISRFGGRFAVRNQFKFYPDIGYPPNGDEIVAQTIQDLYFEPVLPEGLNGLRDTPTGAIVVKHTPLGVYSPPATAGELPATFVGSARPQRWRYCVVRSNSLIATADLLPVSKENESPEVSHVEEGASVGKLGDALRRVLSRRGGGVSNSAEDNQTSEVRSLRIFEAPDVYVSALWVHGETAQEPMDIFIELDEMRRLQVPEFVAKVNDALTSSRGPSQGRVLGRRA